MLLKYKILVRLGVLIIIVISFTFMWWTISQGQLYQRDYGPTLRKEFGFTTGSPYIIAGDEKIEVFVIYPNENGYLHSSGFKDGDIIISESITSFYKLLYNSKGKLASVNVVDGGDGQPIEKRIIRTIDFKIPNH